MRKIVKLRTSFSSTPQLCGRKKAQQNRERNPKQGTPLSIHLIHYTNTNTTQRRKSKRERSVNCDPPPAPKIPTNKALCGLCKKMVKIITCCRTTTPTSRLPSPFNSVSSSPPSSFLFLFPLLPPPSFPLSLSLFIPLFLSFFALDFALFLVSLPFSNSPYSSSGVLLSSGSSPPLPGSLVA